MLGKQNSNGMIVSVGGNFRPRSFDSAIFKTDIAVTTVYEQLDYIRVAQFGNSHQGCSLAAVNGSGVYPTVYN